jgi:hypothetical protein
MTGKFQSLNLLCGNCALISSMETARPQLTLSVSLWEIDWIIGGKDHVMGANLNKKKKQRW